MTQAVATQAISLLEQVVIGGDLSKLSSAERVSYYADVCKSVGLNPLTKPFDYINLNGKLVLYAKRDCTDQLRSLKRISVKIVGRELLGDIYVVTAQATSDGREDESTGAVNVAGKKGDELANAYMKAETKAKRRVTLSIAGLGFLDESEVADIDPTIATPERAVVQMPRAIEKKDPKPEPKSDAQGCINTTQIKMLRKKLEKAGKDEPGFCEHFGIKAVEELPMKDINIALKWTEGS